MNKEKWKELISRLSAGFRRFSFRSVMIFIAAFAMIGVASMVKFSSTTVLDYLDSREEKDRTESVRYQIEEVCRTGENKMVPMVLQYAYTEIDLLGTQSMRYTAKSTYEDDYGFGSFTIPGTRKTIEVECPGVVTAYYRPTDVVWKPDTESRIIYVTFPEKIYVENCLEEEEMSRTDRNGLLNHINERDIEKCIEKLKAEGLAQVEKLGIYELVQEEAEAAIREAFGVLDRYGISFESTAVLRKQENEESEETGPVVELVEPEDTSDAEVPAEADGTDESEDEIGNDMDRESEAEWYPEEDPDLFTDRWSEQPDWPGIFDWFEPERWRRGSEELW